jgi:predicted alpha/beta hydrolase
MRCSSPAASPNPDAPEPVWFGPPERSLLGWMHRPADGRARGAVVLCPPFGIERNVSIYVYRELASRLADNGFLALRFDYDGTGQSAGELNDSGRLDAYRASVEHAVVLVSAQNVRWVAGVGLRLGATILSSAVQAGCPLDAMLLWDPCQSGRAFLREQLLLFGGPAGSTANSSGTEIAGFLLSAETATELRTLEIPRVPAAPAGGTLVLLDPARPGGASLRRHLAGAAAKWDQYREPATVLGVLRPDGELPTAVLDQIVDWLGERCRREPVSLADAGAGSRRAVVARCDDATPIVEEALTIGAHGLFGISTEASRADPGGLGRRRPVLVFLNVGLGASTGPGREWVSLARRWAAAGHRTLRFDLSGIGESPARPNRPTRLRYPPCAVEDIRAAVSCMSPEDPSNVVLVGVSSGAHGALSAAAELRPRGVIAVNPTLAKATPDTWEAAVEDSWGLPWAATERPRLAGDTARAGRRVAAVPRLRRVCGRWRHRLINRIPAAVWSLAFALRLVRSPAELITPPVKLGVPTLVLCGVAEARFPLASVPRALAALGRSRPGSFQRVPGLDHSLRDERSRIAVRDALVAFLADLSSPAPEPARMETAAARLVPRLAGPVARGSDARGVTR